METLKRWPLFFIGLGVVLTIAWIAVLVWIPLHLIGTKLLTLGLFL